MRNRRRVQLPPPPPKSDSASMMDQSQQATAPDPEPERQETQRPGRAGARGRPHGPTSSLPHQPRSSQPAPGRSDGRSRSQQQRAPEWNPLAKLSTHRSGGWKKDLDCYMGAYFRLNYRQEPASKWPELKARFFQFLVEHHSEWKSIRNNDPLGYLPCMEIQFERVTGYKLVGLGTCTEWIREGSYYHWVIAQQGQLGRCPRLAGIPPPVGPMTPPPFLPVTAAPPVTPTAPLTAVGTPLFQILHREGADDLKRSPNNARETPLPRVSKAPPGILGVPETPWVGTAELPPGSPAPQGVNHPRGGGDPCRGEGIPGRLFHFLSKSRMAAFRPSGCCLKGRLSTVWPLKCPCSVGCGRATRTWRVKNYTASTIRYSS